MQSRLNSTLRDGSAEARVPGGARVESGATDASTRDRRMSILSSAVVAAYAELGRLQLRVEREPGLEGERLPGRRRVAALDQNPAAPGLHLQHHTGRLVAAAGKPHRDDLVRQRGRSIVRRRIRGQAQGHQQRNSQKEYD